MNIRVMVPLGIEVVPLMSHFGTSQEGRKVAELIARANAQLNPVESVMQQLCVGRSTVFELWRSGALKSVKIGRRRFSTNSQLADYIARLESGSPGGTAA